MLVSKLSAYFFLGRLGLAAWGSSSGCCPALKARGVAQATPHMGKAEEKAPLLLKVQHHGCAAVDTCGDTAERMRAVDAWRLGQQLRLLPCTQSPGRGLSHAPQGQGDDGSACGVDALQEGRD